VFLALLVLSLGQQAGGGLLLALPAAALGGSVPYLVVQRVAQRRIARFEEQFPEAIALIARALRAGHALPTGLGLVTEEVPEPVRGEFKLLYDRQNYGMPLPDALRAFAERVPLIDARFFATAVLTQREAGGNLAEVLDGLAAIIRDRFRLKRQVRVVSAHGRITGVVLGLMPLAIGAVLFVISPGHITRLLDDPVGLKLVIGAGMLQLIGFIVIRRIVQIEV
jgi:tight adherence protein B